MLVAAPASFGALAAALRFALVRFLRFPAFPVVIVAVGAGAVHAEIWKKIDQNPTAE